MGDLCEFCGNTLQGHRFAEFASAVCNEHGLPDIGHFATLLRHRGWRDLHNFRDFNGSRDALVVHAVECPNSVDASGPIYDMIIVHDPFELYASKQVIERFAAVLDNADTVRSLVREDEWHMF